jgi:two-component system response regulator HydG
LGVSREALSKLVDYSWPGNVRELENVVERAAVLYRGDTLGLSDLPEVVTQANAPAPSSLIFEIGTPLAEVEQRMIRETLKRTEGDKPLAAQLLGISTRTIYRKLEEGSGSAA